VELRPLRLPVLIPIRPKRGRSKDPMFRFWTRNA
jgi:hypothetical protein